jgi:hypothetical protein
MQERKKNQVPTSYLLQDLPLSFFCPTSCSNQESEGFFTNELHTRASTGNQGSRWVRQGWSIATRRGREKGKKKKTKEGGLSPQEGDVRKIRKEKKKTKEGGLSPQEGGVRKRRKKRKRPWKARRWLQRRQGSVCPTPRISFLAHEYLGLEAARLGRSVGSYETWSTRKPCAKEVPETDYFMQQKQYLKRTTLRTH